jgi:hypothetical protein
MMFSAFIWGVLAHSCFKQVAKVNKVAGSKYPFWSLVLGIFSTILAIASIHALR